MGAEHERNNLKKRSRDLIYQEQGLLGIETSSS